MGLGVIGFYRIFLARYLGFLVGDFKRDFANDFDILI
jgi:hypothetical protein